MDRETFGGSDGGQRDAYGQRVSSKYVYEKARNAFVLFYDRVPAPKGARSSATGAGAGAGAGSGSGAGASSTSLSVRNAQSKNRGVIPDKIFKAIWESNLEHWFETNIFDVEYFNFVRRVVEASGATTPVTEYPLTLRTEADALAAGGPGMQAIQLGTSFVLQVHRQELAVRGASCVTASLC